MDVRPRKEKVKRAVGSDAAAGASGHCFGPVKQRPIVYGIVALLPTADAAAFIVAVAKEAASCYEQTGDDCQYYHCHDDNEANGEHTSKRMNDE